MATLDPRERAVVGVGAAVAVIVGAYLFIAEPLMTRAREADASAPVREATLERRRLLIAQRPRLTEELAEVRARLGAESARLLRGPTPPLAASELQKLVKDQLAGSRVEVRSERVLPPADRQGLQEVAIEMTVVGSIRETVSALERLERADRLLALTGIKVRVVAVAQPRELLTTLTVAGYLLPGPAPGGEARTEARAAGIED
jgi:type II secretory pathway component PulM